MGLFVHPGYSAIFIAGERADETFAAAKTWLIQNNSIVMAVLMLVFGISLIGDAVQILL